MSYNKRSKKISKRDIKRSTGFKKRSDYYDDYKLNDDIYGSNQSSSSDNSSSDNSSSDNSSNDESENYVFIDVYTDGSCLSNGNKGARAGSGVYINEEYLAILDDPLKIEISKKLHKNPTNQRAELLAMYLAFEQIYKLCKNIFNIIKTENKKINGFPAFHMRFFSDSKYTIGCMTNWVYSWKKNGWKKKNNDDVKNLDIIKPLYYLSEKLRKYVQNNEYCYVFSPEVYSITHVYAHNKEPKNKESNEWKRWKGNDMADKLAKIGAK